ncbi:hypothetical protein L2E82_26716 [Cichorium intybus]|uniref:Uncharacterized protein n=1 Tax=Cichorium intybus TaxID=13427 RepID=A0ACB9CQZ8_CICIN|nr:hypothetical protein L2E82_26716 [Cichorium intybus]
MARGAQSEFFFEIGSDPKLDIVFDFIHSKIQLRLNSDLSSYIYLDFLKFVVHSTFPIFFFHPPSLQHLFPAKVFVEMSVQ